MALQYKKRKNYHDLMPVLPLKKYVDILSIYSVLDGTL